jgi:CheY-like chemotaxis protein
VARVLVVEPVEDTRVLIERVVTRMGHRVVGGESLRDVDVVFYEPHSIAGLALARRVQRERPDVRLVAITASPSDAAEPAPRPFASLLQPFSPADIRRVLEAAAVGGVAQPA